MKEQTPKPEAVIGTLAFNFWGNDEEKYRNRILSKLSKMLRDKFNLSSIPFYPSDSPEEGMLLIALVLHNKKDFKRITEKISQFVEANSEARLLNDSWSSYDIQ